MPWRLSRRNFGRGRRRVEELQAEAVELAVRLEEAREDLSRWEITRETVALALEELSVAEEKSPGFGV